MSDARGRRLRWFGLTLALLLGGCRADAPGALLRPDGPVLDPDLPRYGLNLGSMSRWGAEQLRANVLWNPGFEPTRDGGLVIVKEVSGGRIVDDTPWLARPDSFWEGGHFDVRSGAAAGLGGSVLGSRKRPGDGLAEFQLDAPVAAGIAPGDVIAISRDEHAEAAPLWWRGTGRFANAPGESRPGSAGTQSVRLIPATGQPAVLLHHLDNIGTRAGKLLPVEGRWRFELWARTHSPDARIAVRFGRDARAPFLDTTLAPTSDWQRYRLEFDAQDSGPAGVLTLALTVTGGEVQLDDAYLGEAEAGAGGFRRSVVQTLRTLASGYLRDWQGQLGDSFANRIATEQGRRGARYRPGDAAMQFHYGLPDFFALCAAVGARPWVVAPTTLDDAEWRALGGWLRTSAETYGFDEILVEFGNENWNPLFRAAGIPDATAHAAVADRGMRLLREGSANDGRIRTVINAQYANPESPRRLAAVSAMADRIAVAPYFLHKLDAGLPTDAAVGEAFRESGERLAAEVQDTAARRKRLAVYEVNFHTTGGSASAAERDALVTGAASAAALAQRLLQATLAGAREQAVYTLAGFDAFGDDGKTLVRLWGITRDLAAADRLRPAGLALALLNRGAGGETRAMHCEGEDCAGLTAVAFDGGRRIALVSARATATEIRVAMTCPRNGQRIEWIDGSDPARNNERDRQVAVADRFLACEGNIMTLSLPAHSVALLRP